MSTRIKINADALPSDAVLETYADGTVWITTPADDNRRPLRQFSLEVAGESPDPLIRRSGLRDAVEVMRQEWRDELHLRQSYSPDTDPAGTKVLADLLAQLTAAMDEDETRGPFSTPTLCPGCQAARDADGEFVHFRGCTYGLPDGAFWDAPDGDIRGDPPVIPPLGPGPIRGGDPVYEPLRPLTEQVYTPRHARRPAGPEPVLMTIGWPMALSDAGALLVWCENQWPGCQLRPTSDPTLAEIFLPASPPKTPLFPG